MVVVLEQGYLTASENEITAFGYAVNKPKWHEYFTSFEATDIAIGDEAIYIESRSGDRCQMRFDCISIDMYEYTEEALRLSGVADLNKYRTIVNEHEKKRRNKMLDMIEPGQLFLRMLNNFEVHYAYYRDSSGEIYRASIMGHEMSHVDCIFVRVYEKVDFRFEAKGMEAEIRRWSGELNGVKMYCPYEGFWLEGKSGYIWCRAGEMTVIGVENFDGEIMQPEYYQDAWEFMLDE